MGNNIDVTQIVNAVSFGVSAIEKNIDLNVSQIEKSISFDVTPNLITVNVNKVLGGLSTVLSVNGRTGNVIGLAEKLYVDNQDLLRVPYIGATSDVNLGEFGIQLGNLEFDLTPTNIPTTVGSMYWNDSDGTLDLRLKGGNVTLQLGQETVARIVNKTATNITLSEGNYQAVRVTGAQGQRPKVDLAQANNDLNSTTTLGLVTETILNNQEGFITTSGQVRGINTTGSLQGETWSDGDILYLSGTVAGKITNIKPIAPIHTVIIGFVEHAHITQGKIFVKVDNGYELDELHNVSAIAPNNNEVLTYDLATTLWKPKTVIDALGYTPYNTTNPSGYISSVPAQSFDSLTGKPTTLLGYGITDAYPLIGNPSGFLTSITSLNVTNALGYTPYDATNPSGYTSNLGTVTNVSALTLGIIGTDLSSTVSNETTTPVITLNIPTASALNRGVLSSADWTIFNNKQNTITPSSLTKVDDTNVTLTLGGSPTNALLEGVSLTLGWNGTLADSRIASASIWNAKQNALIGTGFVKSSAGVISYDTNTYITGNQSISLSGAVTGSGTTFIVTTLANSIVGIANLTATGTPSATTYLRGDNTWAIVEGGGGGGTTAIKLTSQTLTSVSWTLVDGYYAYSFSDANIDATCDVSVTPQNQSYLTAYNAQVLPYIGVATGVATFYSQFPPSADMIVDIVITQTA